MLTRVTITGADDGVDPMALVDLSREFPFVEWGVLMSTGRQGSPRYPTSSWKQRLNRIPRTFPIHIAAHFCGKITRDTVAGSPFWLSQVREIWHCLARLPRIQLNGFTMPAPLFLKEILFDRQEALASPWTHNEFILQIVTRENLGAAADIARQMPRASILFDPSGGRGIESNDWPRPPIGVCMGYAGGIKPETVVRVLEEIGYVEQDFWIDMESGVRTDDKFDLKLVRQVLEAARLYVPVSRGGHVKDEDFSMGAMMSRPSCKLCDE